MSGIVFAGNLIVDHIKEIDRLPNRGELAPIRALSDATGGCVCNTGIDFAVLAPEIPAKALGVAGADADGDLILRTLSEHGFDVSGIVRRGETSFTEVYCERENNCRTFYQYGGANDTFSPADVNVDALDCEIFHIGYLLLLRDLDAPDEEYGTVMARLLHDVQAKGIRTSLDAVSENSDRFRRIISPALKYTDYLTFNEIEAGKTVGLELREEDGTLREDLIPEALSRLFAAGVARQAVIHCPEGAFGMDAQGTFFSEPSKKLPKGYIVGTTGAGDAFCAGILVAALRGWSLPEALRCGNASAQVSLRDLSATGSMVSMEEALREYERL